MPQESKKRQPERDYVQIEACGTFRREESRGPVIEICHGGGIVDRFRLSLARGGLKYPFVGAESGDRITVTGELDGPEVTICGEVKK